MKISVFITVSAAFALSLAPNMALAPPPPAGATCNISCTVADIAEWSDTSSPTINPPELTTQNSRGDSLVLYTNADVKITANPQLATRNSQPATRNPHSASALPESPYGQRSKDDNHKLVVFLMQISQIALKDKNSSNICVNQRNQRLIDKLEYDTADTITVWSTYGSLLNNDSAVKHISADGAGELTLSVTLSNDSGAIGDSGEYSAALTLTACWKS